MEIAATPDINTLNITLPADGERFFVMEEFPAPPVTIFSENFDGAAPGWTTGFDGLDSLMNTPWQLGDSTGGPATGPPAAKGGQGRPQLLPHQSDRKLRDQFPHLVAHSARDD
jgi:hypothetical protein